MRRLLTVALFSAVGCLFVAPMALAQTDAPPAPPPPPAPREADASKPPPPPREGIGPVKMIENVLGKLNLTEDQNTKVKALIEKFQADMKANREAASALEAKIKAAREAKNEADVKSLREQMQKLRLNPEEKVKELVGQIKPLLTEEQTKAFAKALAEARQGPPPMRPGAVLELILKNGEKLGLTDEQKTKLQTLVGEFREANKKLGDAATEADRKALGDKLLADTKEVLNLPGQLEKVKALVDAASRPAPGPGPRGPIEKLQQALGQLKLTEDQRKAIREKFTAFEAAMKTAKDDAERGELRAKLMKDVKSLLPSPEVQQQLETLMREGGGDNPKGPPPPRRDGERKNGPPAGGPPAGGPPPGGPPPL